jgi:hypothetical protein
LAAKLTRSQFGPAAGASGGRAPYAAKFSPPEFLRLDQREIGALLDTLRDPLATQVFMLVLAHGLFENGEFLGGYARLMELCTPPQPERGRRRAGPTYKQLRRAIDDLVAANLLWRNASSNAAQGQLRLRAVPRKTKARPAN